MTSGKRVADPRSSVFLESQPPPVRIIAPGAAYRRDEIDATHLSQFNQMEGLYVDEHIGITLEALQAEHERLGL